MYASPKKQREIGKYIKAYPEDTTVIYFIDLEIMIQIMKQKKYLKI